LKHGELRRTPGAPSAFAYSGFHPGSAMSLKPVANRSRLIAWQRMAAIQDIHQKQESIFFEN
jgi:hypothetical protein